MVGVRHVLAADEHLAFGDFFQARHHAQRGALAAAGLADQRDEFAGGDQQVESLHDGDFAEALDDLTEFKISHGVYVV